MGGIKWTPLVGGLLGIGLSAWLLMTFGAQRIAALLSHAGWLGISALAAFHSVQMLCSALGWRVISASARARVPVHSYFFLRWIREGVDNLLPLAQIGGEVAVSRILSQRGLPLATAIAGTVADFTIELSTQVIFTTIGFALFLLIGQDDKIVRAGVVGVLIGFGLMAGLFISLKFGLARLIERGLVRLGRRLSWQRTAHIEGLNDSLMECYRSPSRIARSGLWHMLSWLLGGVEVILAMHFLGHIVDLKTALVIESLGQAGKALGFAVPGAIGVQEGGYVAVCAVIGLPAELAIALSLMKRLREGIWGIPALFAWQHWEAKARAIYMASSSQILP